MSDAGPTPQQIARTLRARVLGSGNPVLLGIDPGLSGALVWLDAATHAPLAVQDMPLVAAGTKAGKVELSAALLAAQVQQGLLKWPTLESAVVERVSSRPGEGVTSAFRFGTNYGTILGVLAALHVPVVHMQPATWKRSAGIPAGSDKDAARAKALLLWPDHASAFARKKDIGRADAALIALSWAKSRLGAERA